MKSTHQYQERHIEEDRKPGGKTRVRDMESVWLKEEGILDRTKWNNDIHNNTLHLHYYFLTLWTHSTWRTTVLH